MDLGFLLVEDEEEITEIASLFFSNNRKTKPEASYFKFQFFQPFDPSSAISTPIWIFAAHLS